MKTKEDIRKAFSVSGATLANWVKTGFIPEYDSGKKAYSCNNYDKIVKDINSSGKLKSRANRFHSQLEIPGIYTSLASDNKRLLKKILFTFRELNSNKSISMLALCLSALEQKSLINVSYSDKITKKIKIEAENTEFSDFLSDWAQTMKADELAIVLEKISQFRLPENETDFLGAVYESMRNLGEKSKLGAFFTPSILVNDLKINSDSNILDPCCGTGTILLSIINPENPPISISLRDIDQLALGIAKVNFALFFKSTKIPVNINCENALNWVSNEKFDFIVTNPPWGANFDENTKAEIVKQEPDFKNADSFNIILCQALKKLTDRGKLVFILPESFLYVDAHFQARRKVFETQAEVQLKFFGNAFKDVQSKVIRLELNKSSKSSFCIFRNNQRIELSADLLKKNNFRPPAVNSPEEMQILEKILSNKDNRLNSSTFGLGVVTGNNKKHLLENKLDESEVIFTGKELQPFKFINPRKFIKFNPKKLQQCAPLHLYRSPKICYRFISDKLQMVADTEGVLVLNSINFFVPPDNYNIKALATFFNSPVCTFLYQRLFNSVKVLRNHIEKMPIPDGYFEQQIALEKLYARAEKGCDVKDELLEISCRIFEIDVENFKKIKY